jgi:hypothetical protein
VLIVGGFLAAAAALLAGTSGFGFALLATPALLLCGFSLPFVVTVNLLIALATRVSVAWRLRDAIDRRRVGLLVGAAVPGLWIGSRTLGELDEHTLKLAVGVVIALATATLAWSERRAPAPLGRDPSAVAGFLGGLLGTTTSLLGVPPALLLGRRRPPIASFFADLSLYFVATAAIGLVVLGAEGQFSGGAARAFAWWLPGVLVANAIGTTLGLRLPPTGFRRLTLGLAFAAGVVTAVTA